MCVCVIDSCHVWCQQVWTLLVKVQKFPQFSRLHSISSWVFSFGLACLVEGLCVEASWRLSAVCERWCLASETLTCVSGALWKHCPDVYMSVRRHQQIQEARTSVCCKSKLKDCRCLHECACLSLTFTRLGVMPECELWSLLLQTECVLLGETDHFWTLRKQFELTRSAFHCLNDSLKASCYVFWLF